MANNPRFLVVHHTGRSNSTVATIRHTHVVERGWSDIGYHSVIYKNGEVHAARPEHVQGAHAANYARPDNPALVSITLGQTANVDSLGVVLCGNFQIEVPTAVQIDALMWRLASWCRDYDINPEHIWGHRDFLTPKLCPGQNVYRLLPSIRANLRVPIAQRVPAWSTGQPR